VDETAIREGVRRIGKVVAEQVALYGTLTGAAPAAPAATRAERAPADAEQLADVLQLPRRQRSGDGGRAEADR
jgi:2-aminoadipate transaminase